MVLILHPSDELKFIRLQKKITASFNADGFRVYPEIPLWTAVPDKAAEKLAAGKARLEIGAPETDRSKATIRCPAEIRTESGTYGAELVLCRMESVPDDAEKRLMHALGENAEKKKTAGNTMLSGGDKNIQACGGNFSSGRECARAVRLRLEKKRQAAFVTAKRTEPHTAHITVEPRSIAVSPVLTYSRIP